MTAPTAMERALKLHDEMFGCHKSSDLISILASQIGQAEQAAREEEAEEIARHAEDSAKEHEDGSPSYMALRYFAVRIRQRHAKKPEPEPEPDATWNARPGIPHSSSIAYESRIRDIAREEIANALWLKKR